LALDYIIWGCGFLAEAGLILLLIRMRVFRVYPAFFLFVCWSLVSDFLFFFLQTLPDSTYSKLYVIQVGIDTAMIFAVLLELAWSVLRPIRSSLPRRSVLILVVILGLAGLALWPVAGIATPGNLTHKGEFLFRLDQTASILRIVFFLALAGFSQLLSIGWRNRELQIATGMGIYSIVSLSVSILHTHQIVGPQYHWLDQVMAVSYLGALSYWVLAFATKEAERQDFSPQMQSFLLLVGGTAKAGRVAVSDFGASKTRRRDD